MVLGLGEMLPRCGCYECRRERTACAAADRHGDPSVSRIRTVGLPGPDTVFGVSAISRGGKARNSFGLHSLFGPLFCGSARDGLVGRREAPTCMPAEGRMPSYSFRMERRSRGFDGYEQYDDSYTHKLKRWIVRWKCNIAIFRREPVTARGDQ
ncbi:hypothetical protein AG1IA_06949 [Rhizoctonia solani AG-1 IA]|uniref:Uncharacterized protein n=1 Tax=Thanatephorus cucumeris (strain AG1-IA) TaxID=983506 RepID=L8WQI3_THACA|nr:hypothetical protein AG1IA_06949 [Rhizoctonia solani AG-1 IA]